MKQLKDLKEDILANKIEKFYVFYGPDYGIRHHYIHKLLESFDGLSMVDTASSISGYRTKGFFKSKMLRLIYNDQEFANSKANIIQQFIDNIRDDTVILVYEDELPNSVLWKEFNDYITYFPTVDSKIALEFIDSETKLGLASKNEMAYNCDNNYNLICLEADKINEYSQSRNISNQVAYDELKTSNQLVYKYEPFKLDDFIDDLLLGNKESIGHWYTIIKNKYYNEFWYGLYIIFTNYLIAFNIVKYGKYEGSSRSYNEGLNWSRCKHIRDLYIPFTAEYLYNVSYKIAKMDALVKSGVIQIENLIDYFITAVI